MTDINYQLSKELGDELKRIGATISTVESCTGGGLASSMTDVSGSSQWFTSGLVTYSNFSKKNILGVQEELISSLGAVSLEVVREMAIKGLQKTGSDYVISVSPHAFVNVNGCAIAVIKAYVDIPYGVHPMTSPSFSVTRRSE